MSSLPHRLTSAFAGLALAACSTVTDESVPYVDVGTDPGATDALDTSDTGIDLAEEVFEDPPPYDETVVPGPTGMRRLTQTQFRNVELRAHKKITIVNEMGADAPTLRVDRRRFRQSLYNLLSNALKFTPAGRSVGIRWSIERPGWICIEVWDQGIGIAEKDLEFIFDEFYQVDRKRDEALGGSGIGLALTRRLANLHGGEVRVKSQTGFGSRFFLVMPISSVQAVPERGASEGAGAAASSESDMDSGARILVVDDDSPNLAVIRGFLRVRGIDPLVARSGEEAVEMVGRERPHLVFMDIHMPGCDGFEALARIRENSSLAGIPILAMTASASESDRARYEAAGFDGFLPKPIDSAKLDGYLAELAERLEQAAARPVA